MSEKYSIASKKKWEAKTKEQKIQHMSMMAKKKWEKVSVEDRKAHALLMVSKRKEYANKTNTN